MINTSARRFDTVLIANRGEIALRIIRGARAAGLRTVAVYSDADVDAIHVRVADAAVRLGPAPAAKSYLSIPALVRAAAQSGADAVHPGYGFLSERAAFARACTEAGLIFIGPNADVIDLMGRKDSARQVAIAAGVPVVPAVDDTAGGDLLARALDEVGLPLLVKAAAGGGGKGMRIVRSAVELPDALAAAKREAASAFGDETVLIERYVERGRHVEVQVIADTHGNVLHLFERDCSTQRRHQKVLEEAPAPTISEAIRKELTIRAVDLTRSCGYTNAGTVEFLVEEENIYLLEMNTRLQVEHPVTEFVTGLDLVALQLLVAQGDELPVTQEQVQLSGHAIEARVYAEDPDAGFLPQAGRATAVHWPARARVDAALETGQTVGTWYDPMLGKIIVHAESRESARHQLIDALDDTNIFGLSTNIAFLRRLAASDEFRDATIDTAWLDRNPDGLLAPDDDAALWIAAAWMLTAPPVKATDPFAAGDSWRIAAPAAPTLVDLQTGSTRKHVIIDRTSGLVEFDTTSATLVQLGAERFRDEASGVTELCLDLDGVSRVFAVQHHRDGLTVGARGRSLRFHYSGAAGAEDNLISDGRITAPMPGVVTVVRAVQGQRVAAGDTLVVLEAMKMEHALTAAAAGTVETVRVAPRDQVALGQVLLTVTHDDEDASDLADQAEA